MPTSRPRVYIDTCVFLNVLKREQDLWPSSLQVLAAAERRDIQVVASWLLPAELGRVRGDASRGQVDALVEQYLDDVSAEWWEVDVLVQRDARELSWLHDVRSGADAIHLATAVRANCSYFMSRDGTFPYGETIGSTVVTPPKIVWAPTIDDETIEAQAQA